MYHGPYNALSGEGSSPIPEGHRGIQVYFAAPPDCKIDGCDWVEKYPPIPAREIQFPDEDPLAGESESGFLDEGNNGLGVWQCEFPNLSTMEVGVHVGVDATVQLGAVNHCTSNLGVLLFDGVERAAENSKGELRVVERSDECTELDFLVDVMLHIFLK